MLTVSWGYEYSNTLQGHPAWVFTANCGLLRTAYDSGFFSPPTPAGTQAAFLQAYQGRLGYIQQTVFFPNSGRFRLRWLDAGRSAQEGGNADYVVRVDNMVISNNRTQTAQPFTARSAEFEVTSGEHSLQFALVGPTAGDQTSLIDDIMIEAISVDEGLPTISSQPQSQTAAIGSSVTLSVVASGAPPLFYQWREYGTDIFGATTSSYTINNLQTNHAALYSVLVSNMFGSITSDVAVLTVTTPELVRLADYYPLPLGVEWVYTGSDAGGQPAKSIRRVDATDTSVTLYTGRTPATSYSTNVVSEYNAYVNPTTLVPYDEWTSYMAGGSRFGYFGDTGAGDLRLDRGAILPEYVMVGAAITNLADAYVGGTFVGSVSLVVDVMERTSITVPAGSFPDVLRVRISIIADGNTRAHDEWWARSVGSVKEAGVSGDGVLEQWELIQYSLPLPPSLSIHLAGSVPVLGIGGTLNASYALEYRTNLAAGVWRTLATLTLTNSPQWFSDVTVTNALERFYRLRQEP